MLSRNKSKFLILILLAVLVYMVSCSPESSNVEIPDNSSYYDMTWQQFKNYGPANEQIDWNNVNHYLLNAAIFHDTNKLRSENSKTLFKYSKALETAAHRHSMDMINQDFFAHDNPRTGKDPFQRMADCGVTGGSRAENIACSSTRTMTYNQLAEFFVHDQWKNSPGHMKNMMGNYTYLGAGSYSGNTNNIFNQTFPTVVGTQNFGTKVPE